ncbi:MAG: hypothetical protein EP318_14155 [Rhodobacteraceae bacterium]|nr:MAG: hypothetical protein EP318_14155 [Paracoccaceae bacterium]
MPRGALPTTRPPARPVLALALCLLALPVLAADMPDWWPAQMVMPEDSQIDDVREIGSRIRMLAFRTDQDAETLLKDWADRLEAAGYTVDWNPSNHGQPSFEFEGEAVLNGQAVSTRCHEACVTRLQVDMTLE